jgi:Ca2+-transporting ATPase
VGKIPHAIAIVVIVLLNAVIGFVQEYRAERALAALRQMSAPAWLVCRDGTLQKLPSRDLVPDGVVVIAAGDVVPADVRLLKAIELKIDSELPKRAFIFPMLASTSQAQSNPQNHTLCALT